MESNAGMKLHASGDIRSRKGKNHVFCVTHVPWEKLTCQYPAKRTGKQ
jgi:hypothetical protein